MRIVGMLFQNRCKPVPTLSMSAVSCNAWAWTRQASANSPRSRCVTLRAKYGQDPFLQPPPPFRTHTPLHTRSGPNPRQERCVNLVLMLVHNRLVAGHRVNASCTSGGVACMRAPSTGYRCGNFSFMRQAMVRWDQCPFTPDRNLAMYSASAKSILNRQRTEKPKE